MYIEQQTPSAFAKKIFTVRGAVRNFVLVYIEKSKPNLYTVKKWLPEPKI
jgi:hypothetical protein